eukprot:1336549-Rhodomonas_salina.3
MVGGWHPRLGRGEEVGEVAEHEVGEAVEGGAAVGGGGEGGEGLLVLEVRVEELCSAAHLQPTAHQPHHPALALPRARPPPAPPPAPPLWSRPGSSESGGSNGRRLKFVVDFDHIYGSLEVGHRSHDSQSYSFWRFQTLILTYSAQNDALNEYS